MQQLGAADGRAARKRLERSRPRGCPFGARPVTRRPLRDRIQLPAASKSSANSNRLTKLNPATDVDSEPVAKMPEIGEERVRRMALRRSSSSLETVYCAELVVTTYQHMGLLPLSRPASWYDPGRFWSGDHIALVAPYALAPEIAVR